MSPIESAMLTNPDNHVFGMTPESLRAFVAERGMAGFRADQILEWIYAHGVADPAEMSNLSRHDRETVRRELAFLTGETLAHQSATDGVQKLLIQWNDASKPRLNNGNGAPPVRSRLGEPCHPDPGGMGVPPVRENLSINRYSEEPNPDLRLARAGLAGSSDGQASLILPILQTSLIQQTAADTSRQSECVMIPADPRRTACISSQVGCPVGCRFCASGLGGLDGNLSAGRIVEQVWRLSRLTGVGRITNVVFMGMGEPLANFDNVKRAIETIAAPWGMNISARKITVSTVGLPKYIERLARDLDLPVTLALSLHAPTDDIRRSLIPWSEFTTIADLLAACRLWFEKTGREITLEYTLMRGVNDRPEHARELARLARSMRSNVNLIRYNEVAGLPFERPRDDDVREFQTILRDAGVSAHIRASRGRDIAAACGQLRHETAGA